MATTYVRIATTRPFLETVVEQRQLPFTAGQLQAMVSVRTESNPPALSVRVRNSDPNFAAKIAQDVAEEFVDYAIEQRLAEIARIQSVATAQGIANVRELVAAQFVAVDSLSILEPVLSPRRPVIPRTRQNVVIGVILGLMLAGGGAFLLEIQSDRVRSPDLTTRKFGTSDLGTIMRWSPQDSPDGLIMSSAPTSNYAEAFRQLRANLEFATVNKTGNLFMVCSPGAGEGKTTIVANLAAAVAQTGKRVIIVDCDLRRPSMHRVFQNVGREPGLSNYLATIDPDFRDFAQPSGIEGIDLIPAGPTPPNPAELLGSPKMTALLEELSAEYGTVFVDSPPLLPVADASILSSSTTGVLIVVDGDKTRSASLQRAIGILRSANADVIGVVINKLKKPRFGYGYPYYYYYYDSYYRYYGEDDPSRNGDSPLYRRMAVRAKNLIVRKRD